jgi:flagellum-specific peptidoglycan hydrolase FlgJ
MNHRSQYKTLEETVVIQSVFIMILFVALLISLSINISKINAFAYDGDTTEEYSVDNSILIEDQVGSNVSTDVETTYDINNVVINTEETKEETTVETSSTETETTYTETTTISENTIITTEPVVIDNNINTLNTINTGILTTEEINVDKFRQTVEIVAPELIGIEDAILQVYTETGINPYFQLAKFCLESGYGTSDLSIYKNNIAGWNAYPSNGLSSYENATYFNSKSECVITVGTSLYNNYINNGLTTVEGIASKYCPVNQYNWASLVNEIMYDIESVYNSI